MIGGRKMENKNLDSYGYLLNCPNEMLGYVNKIMNDKQAPINWNKFNICDYFYTEKYAYKCVIADHPMKRIVFVTKDEYDFNYKYKLKNNGNLVQKLNWDMPFIKNQCMFVYAEADLDSNQKMQEPLQKLYQYENQPDMRKKIREYISELDTEINRCENELQKYYKSNGDIGVISMQNRIQVLIEVKNDLLGRMEEVV
jgi:hypothetical protein